MSQFAPVDTNKRRDACVKSSTDGSLLKAIQACMSTSAAVEWLAVAANLIHTQSIWPSLLLLLHYDVSSLFTFPSADHQPFIIYLLKEGKNSVPSRHTGSYFIPRGAVMFWCSACLACWQCVYLLPCTGRAK